MTKPLNKEQEKLLNDIYFKQKMFFGRDKLFQYLRANHLEMNISRRQVMNWLKSNELNQLYSPAKKTKDIQRTITKAPFKQVGIDLIDKTSSSYNGYKWILTGIDLFSKKGYAVPMKNKTTKDVINAMKKMLKQMKELPGSIRSDSGSEFISKEFKALMEKNNIKQVLSKPNSPQSNGNVERFNGILKRLIEKNDTQFDDKNFVKFIPIAIRNYNQTISRVTGKTPNEIEEQNKEENEETKNTIKKNVIAKNDNQDIQKFKLFDKVRIKMENINFSKSGMNWSRNLYRVSKVIAPKKENVMTYKYKIRPDKKGSKSFSEVFYTNDLQKINDIKNKVKAPEKFIVSSLVKPIVDEFGRRFYEVRWKGYPASENTIEPREQLMLDVPKLVEQTERNMNIKWGKKSVFYDKN